MNETWAENEFSLGDEVIVLDKPGIGSWVGSWVGKSGIIVESNYPSKRAVKFGERTNSIWRFPKGSLKLVIPVAVDPSEKEILDRKEFWDKYFND